MQECNKIYEYKNVIPSVEHDKNNDMDINFYCKTRQLLLFSKCRND